MEPIQNENKRRCAESECSPPYGPEEDCEFYQDGFCSANDAYYAALRASAVAKTVAEVARINHALSFIAGFDAYVQRMDNSDAVAQTLVLLGWNEECKETLENALCDQKYLLLKQRQRPSDCHDLTEEEVCLLIKVMQSHIPELSNRGDLEAHYSDEKDFFETSIWSLKEALTAAYLAGKKDALKE